MRKLNHAYHVRFRNLRCVVKCAAWSEWIGPVIALGPFAAAKAVVKAEDWSSLPIDLCVEVQDEGLVREYLMTVSLRSTTLVTMSGPGDVVHLRTMLPR